MNKLGPYLLVLFSLFGACQTKDNVPPCKQLDEVDLKMLNMVEQIEKEYAGDKIFIQAFKESQLYWTQYRNRQVKAMFPLSPKKYKYDVGQCKCEIYRDLTTLRVMELQRWIDGVSSGEDCKGTLKVRK